MKVNMQGSSGMRTCPCYQKQASQITCARQCCHGTAASKAPLMRLDRYHRAAASSGGSKPGNYSKTRHMLSKAV